ncbi:MAG: RnfABCDGE type electron transport complex subunit G [Candidatus Omnitrophota bacterium]
MNKLIRFALVLFLVNMTASSILAVVYNITKPKIEYQKKLVEKESLKEVMPESVGDIIKPVYRDEEIAYWEVFAGDGLRVTGYVFIAKKYGYSSIIESMVGIKKDGTITGVRVLSQNETPGLGAKIVEIVSNKTLINAIKNIFSKKEEEKKILPYFTEQFKGLDAKRLSPGDIQAITGATISSRACLGSIKEKALEILDDR